LSTIHVRHHLLCDHYPIIIGTFLFKGIKISLPILTSNECIFVLKITIYYLCKSEFEKLDIYKPDESKVPMMGAFVTLNISAYAIAMLSASQCVSLATQCAGLARLSSDSDNFEQYPASVSALSSAANRGCQRTRPSLPMTVA
jgi:hypothetical protein